MKKIIFTILLASLTFLQADSYKLTTSDNKIINVEDTEDGLLFNEYKGKVVFLVLFGHNCPPCRAEIPELINLKNKYKDKFEVIGLEVQGFDSKQLDNFKKSEGINYNIISTSEHNNMDFLQDVGMRGGWKGAIPFLIVIDKNGKVKDVIEGLASKAMLEERIQKLSK
jgi:thiol-disulfide isomerase/thioredoxin